MLTSYADHFTAVNSKEFSTLLHETVSIVIGALEQKKLTATKETHNCDFFTGGYARSAAREVDLMMNDNELSRNV